MVKEQVNVIADPNEATEDRGPLVEDEDIAKAKNKIESKVEGSLGSSPEDVLAFLEADEEEEEEETYLDSRVPLARDTRPMIAAWHEYKNAMAQIKTNYKLLKVESELSGNDGQDQRKEGLVQSASRVKRALDAIEADLKSAFPKLAGVAWLTRSEILVMPTWMHKLLGVTVEANENERIEAQAQLQERLDGEQYTE